MSRQFSCLALGGVLEAGTVLLVEFLEAFGRFVAEVGRVSSRCRGNAPPCEVSGSRAHDALYRHRLFARGYAGESLCRFRTHEGGVALGSRAAIGSVVVARSSRHDPHEIVVVGGLLELPGCEVRPN